MTRYYFDLHNGDGQTRDEQGMDLPSPQSASKEVARILADVARDELATADRVIVAVKVRDQEGRIVSVATLAFTNEWMDN